MRREERHHLKGNPLAVSLANVGEFLYNPGRAIVVAVVLFLVVAIGGGGYFFLKGRRDSRIGELIAEAMFIMEAEVANPPGQEETGGGENSSGDVSELEQPQNSFHLIHG